MRLKQVIAVFAALLLLTTASARRASAYSSVAKLLDKPEEWYRGDEAQTIAASVLSYQSPLGGWPKDIDTGGAPFTGDPATLRGTFDNGATTFELKYLAKMFAATKDPRYEQPFLKGLAHILAAQYPNGGWPQYHPPGDDYSRHITFNDGAMARLMFFLRDVAKEDGYRFVGDDRRASCRAAWDRGVECILNCQVKVNGKLTIWGAQHDEKDFSPRPARTFEPASLAALETIGIVHVLMAVDPPTPRIDAAIDATAAWYEAAKIHGIGVEDRPDPNRSKGYHRVVVKDPTAPPMWARFYEIGTNRPIFADRDGVVRYDLAELGDERRNGYKWYGTWARNFLEKEYPEWKSKRAAAAAADIGGNN
jgi:PelA/Pel-15E family pectate lyase